jgi:hypothetical protein
VAGDWKGVRTLLIRYAQADLDTMREVVEQPKLRRPLTQSLAHCPKTRPRGDR